MNAYILYGGKGTRVSSLMEKYNVTNKHDLPVDAHPFVEYVERSLYSSPMVKEVVKLGSNTGTGGAIRDIGRLPNYPYILTCGDMLVEGLSSHIESMYGMYLQWQTDMIMVTMEVSEPDYGKVELSGLYTVPNNRVDNYTRRHSNTNDYYTNVGMYMISEKFHSFLLDYPQANPLSLELDIFENKDILGTSCTIFELFNVVSYRVNTKSIYDIGTISRFDDTNNRLKW